MERDYIAALGNAYGDFFEHYTAAPVLTIDTNDLDFVRRPDDLRAILDHIRAKLESGAVKKSLFDKGGGG